MTIVRILLLAVAAVSVSARVSLAQSTIAVSSTCSLAEAIHAANFDTDIAFDGSATGCTPGSGDDTIVLTAGTVVRFTRVQDDADSPFGPAALPIVFSTITIEGNGARLEAAPPEGVTFRAFSVGEASIKGPDGVTRTGTGNLTLRNLHIKGFAARGGDGWCGGGGGMGAGGAVYAGPGSTLTIENSTLEFNGAIGGDALNGVNSGGCPFGAKQGHPGGGGGGMGGHGGSPDITNAVGVSGAGGGGGGARGNGGDAELDRGGGGGGTLGSGGYFGGTRCGATGTDPGDNGADGTCAGGGGAGGGEPGFLAGVTYGGDGGTGAYGGGGGGGGVSETYGGPLNYGRDGGSGGFGGGGGACGGQGVVLSTSGGGSAFGGGGGMCREDPGGGGFFFGGHGGKDSGGSGAGLGGGVFSHAATVTIANSTLTGNYAVRGFVPDFCGGFCELGQKGNDLGGAVFAFQGSLTILNSTIAGNENTGSFGGVVYLNINLSILGTPPPGSFTLRNTIISHNGVNFSAPSECAFFGGNITVQGSGNLILQNDTEGPCPGVVSNSDPELLPLRLNIPGLTPTMAILGTSSAADAADPATSLRSDQRGVDRPSLDGYDIGAYEARLPHFVIAPISPISLELGATTTSTVTVISADNFMNPVSLRAETGTTGLEASFDTSSVTPLPDRSASATLTVHAGSSVVAGVHTLSLVFTSPTPNSGTLRREVVMQVQVGVTSEGMARTIEEFLELGEIANVGIAAALTSKLTVAQQLIDGGETQVGVNVLGAFGWQVRALSGKQIASAAATRLLANLDVLAQTVSAGLMPNPLIGTVVDAAGLPVSGAIVDILDGTKSKIASAESDAAGLYYVARTTKWRAGTTYSVKITLPKGYKRSTPSTQPFTWQGSQTALPAFVLSN